jgi:hypothetical protein
VVGNSEVVNKKVVWLKICNSSIACSRNTTYITIYSSKCVPLMGMKSVILSRYLQPQKNLRLDPNSAKAQGITLSAVRFVCRDL